MKFINYISIFFIVILALIIFKSWIFSPILSAGDSWYYFSSMYGNHFLHPYAWYTYSVSTGLGGQGFAYMNTYMVVSFLLRIAEILNISWENVSRIVFNLSFVVISIISSIYFIRKLFPKVVAWVLAPIIFVFNTYLLMLVGGGLIITALSYALIPFTLYSFMKIIETKEPFERPSIFTAIGITFLLFTQCILDMRIAFVTFSAMLIFLIISFFYRDLKIKNLLIILVALISTAFLSSYWLIPLALFRIDPIDQLGLSYSSSEIVKFLSFANLENAFGLMHPYWPDNIFGKIGFMKAEFLLLPIIAFSSLLFIKKGKEGKYVLFFILVALIGIFLGKGASEPFGSVYIWLFEKVPGFQLFRDSFKWYVLISLSYSVLIPFSVNEIGELLNKKIKNKYPSYILILLVVIYFLYLIRPVFMGQLNGTFKIRNLPQEYLELNNFLSSEPNFMRTFWVPNTMLYGYYSNIHPEISGTEFFVKYEHDKLLDEFSKESSKKQLELSGVKYVIVSHDTEKQIYLTDRKYDEKKYKYIVNRLDRITWLKKEKQFGKIIVYRTQTYKDHFWCDCDAKISWNFVNPTKYKVSVKGAGEGDVLVFSEAFDNKWVAQANNSKSNSVQFEKKFNSFKLPKGDSDLEIYYSPQKIVDLGLLVSLISAFAIVFLALFLVIKRKK